MKFSGVLIKGLSRELQCAAATRTWNVDSNETRRRRATCFEYEEKTIARPTVVGHGTV